MSKPNLPAIRTQSTPHAAAEIIFALINALEPISTPGTLEVPS